MSERPEAEYVKKVVKALRAGHQYSGIVDEVDTEAANLIEALYLVTLGVAQATRDALIEQCAQIAMKHGDRLEIHSQRIADAIRSLNGTAVSSTDRILVTKSSGCVFCDIGVPPLDGIHYAEGEEIPCPLSSTESNSP